eukprot:Ihof_evm5s124 gene=Ihof_evmTU5s124
MSLRKRDMNQLEALSPNETSLKEQEKHVKFCTRNELVLEAFSKTPWVEFGNAVIGERSLKELIVYNPQTLPAIIFLSKFPISKGFSIDGEM